MKLLEGKTVLVTGTRRGMGRRMLELFSEHGANLFAHARTYDAEHERYCQEIAARCGTQIWPIYFELTDQEGIKNAVKTIRGHKIPIDGLVNNAGITYNALFHMTSFAELRNQMEVNFFAPYLLTQYISKMMVKEKKGSIVNISSSAALDGNSGKSAYGASKAALVAMTLVISEELAVSGIRANAICPGVTDTEMLGTVPEYVLDDMWSEGTSMSIEGVNMVDYKDVEIIPFK